MKIGTLRTLKEKTGHHRHYRHLIFYREDDIKVYLKIPIPWFYRCDCNSCRLKRKGITPIGIVIDVDEL